MSHPDHVEIGQLAGIIRQTTAVWKELVVRHGIDADLFVDFEDCLAMHNDNNNMEFCFDPDAIAEHRKLFDLSLQTRLDDRERAMFELAQTFADKELPHLDDVLRFAVATYDYDTGNLRLIALHKNDA